MESFLYGIQTQSPNGILGDPTGSTPGVGDELLRLAAESLAEELREPAAVT
jgi:creatinine amidohydrolase/Fe(II)-dependent formamide hydrolase-like protein